MSHRTNLHRTSEQLKCETFIVMRKQNTLNSIHVKEKRNEKFPFDVILSQYHCYDCQDKFLELNIEMFLLVLCPPAPQTFIVAQAQGQQQILQIRGSQVVNVYIFMMSGGVERSHLSAEILTRPNGERRRTCTCLA